MGLSDMVEEFSGYEPASKPTVKIMKCIGFQKFRYCGENRPGKKYQDKDFMQLALSNMSGKNVCIQIVCFDAERENEIHPNGLVGRDCECGIYSKNYPISKSTQIIRIPYLRTERILTKKTNKEEGNNKQNVFNERAKILPQPFREWCLRQAKTDQKYDTTRVCFGVIVTIEGSNEPLFCLSNVVQNASEKTTLRILKLSTQYVSAQEGGVIDIFTSEDGPPITAEKCSVRVVIHDSSGNVTWESDESTPSSDYILYKRVVTYRVPAYLPNPATDCAVRGVISLSCTQSGQTCTYDFCYEPGADSARRLATIHSNKPLRKRPYFSEPVDEENRFADNIKMRVKEKVRSRQNQAEPVMDMSRPEPVQVVQSIAASNGVSGAGVPMSSGEQDTVPLHQQDDIVLAKDMVTGEIVYIRTPQVHNAPQVTATSSDIVVYMQDGANLGSTAGITVLSEAPRTCAVSEWNEVVAAAATFSPATSTSMVRTIDSASKLQQQRSVVDQGAGPSGSASRKKRKFVSPWIVAELENTPLVNGDISFSQPREAPAAGPAPVYTREVELKREPAEMGPPILTPGQNLQISSENVPGMSNNLLSGTLISSTNLPSLGSLLANGVLEGVKFDDTGTLLSSSVFEMVKPYMQ
ncbi:uncharacterized protein LOC143281072 isoform X2 [Babylonia areolata]|uniref:uncharacterized protein LOC143281072 isoform X2 n=1 Tax=Babylonia areolata TaxID=304850 RepID=UPI003FD25FE4